MINNRYPIAVAKNRETGEWVNIIGFPENGEVATIVDTKGIIRNVPFKVLQVISPLPVENRQEVEDNVRVDTVRAFGETKSKGKHFGVSNGE